MSTSRSVSYLVDIGHYYDILSLKLGEEECNKKSSIIISPSIVYIVTNLLFVFVLIFIFIIISMSEPLFEENRFY